MSWKTFGRRENQKASSLSNQRRPRRLLAENLEERRLLAAVIRSGAGAAAVDVQAIVDQFRADLGEPVNGAQPGSAAAGRREINWDGVPDNFAAPNAFPANFFNSNSPRGVVFETLGSGFSVSAKAGNPTATAVRFGDINAAYAAQFQTFSAERLFTAVGSNITDVSFFVPGTNLPATVRGFGVVFADVDIAGGTTLEFFDAAGNALGAPVVATPFDNGLSFLGVSYDAGERIARVRITSGTVALSGTAVDGGTDDVVAMDDFLYAEPQSLGNLFVVDAANNLVRLNPADQGAVGLSTPITGLQSGESILGIDFRPATGQLYALGSSNQLYTIDTTTAVATAVGGALSASLVGDSFGVDFNPAVDRLRVVSNAEQNLRINPITGELVAEDTALNPDSSIVAAAYTNNGPAAGVTTLYGLDATSNSLVRIGGVDGQPSPNGGEVTVVGELGVDFTDAAGFDIAGGSGTAYAVLTVEGSVKLFSIDLTTGTATDLGALGVTGPIQGMAVAIPPRVEITASTLVTEEDAGTQEVILTVTLSEAATTQVTVDFATQDDTAIAGTDYDATSGTLTFPAGTTSQQITVVVRSDDVANGNRSFKVVLSNISAAVVAKTTEGTVTILDDDDAVPVAADDAYDANEDEVLNVAAPGLLANDTNATMISQVDDTSLLGVPITFNADGSFSYDPTNVALIQALAVDESVEDEFSYTASDLEGNTSTATVRITLAGRNDLPIAEDDDLSTVEAYVRDEEFIVTIGQGALLINDQDVDTKDTLIVLSVDSASALGATITLDGLGNIIYNPRDAVLLDALSNGQDILDTFEYVVSDQKGGMDIGKVTLKVLGLNDPPQAGDDAFSATPDATLTMTYSELIANDTDVDQADVLVISQVQTTSAKGAIVTLNGDGSVTYDPTGVQEFQDLQLGETATDTFTYTISDGQGASSSATVTITITPDNGAPTPVADTGATNADTVLNVVAPGLLANDTDPDAGDTLAVVVAPLTSTLGATVTLNADGSYSYDPTAATELKALAAGATVEDTFTYTVRDLAGAEATATVTITITGVNDAPIAGDDVGQTSEDSLLTALAGALFGNDSDPDTGDTFTADEATTTSTLGAKVSILADGSYSYDPREVAQFQALQVGESLEDTFTYTIRDAAGLTATATVTIAVNGANDAPVAADDTAATNEDAVLNGAANALLANDSDPDTTDTLSLVAGTYTSTLGAAVTINADGSYSYDPTGAKTIRTLKEGETVVDTFTYTLRDAAGLEDTATVSVTVTGVAGDDPGPAFTVSSPIVVEGDDGELAMEFTVTLEFASLQAITMNYATADGTATAGADYTAASGTLTFAPGTLTQTFTVQILGDTIAEADETITINITDAVNTATATGTATGTIDDNDNQPPTAVADTGATTEDAILTVTDPLLIANDTDPDNHVPLVVVAETVTSTNGATVTINADGSYSYDPTNAAALQALAEGATIEDTFTYKVRDALGAESVGTVTITVTGVNDAPVAQDDAFETTEDDVLTVTVPGLLANDSDPDTGDTLTVTGPAFSVLGAILVFNPDGSFTYDPRNVGVLQRMTDGATGNDEFTYTVSDGKGGAVTATVIITVTGINDNPVASPDNYAVNEDEVLTVDAASGVLSNDGDAELPAMLTVTAGNFTSTYGAAVVMAADGSFTYDPRGSSTLRTLAIGQTVDDTFTYEISDADGGTAVGTVTVVVTGTTEDGVPKITIENVSQAEGDSGETIFTFTVSLGYASLANVTVDYATADEGGIDSATAGEDYTATSGTLTITPGNTTATIEVIVLADTKLENDETFLLNLSNGSGGIIDVDKAIATITNDDAEPSISIADANVLEGDSGTANLTFTVTLSNPSEREITVDFATADGTAAAGSDYISQTGTITFAAGETSKTITINVLGDTTEEPNETLIVTLSNPTNATIADGEATGTITDDEGGVLSISDATVVEGNDGEVDLVFTVALSAVQATDVTFDFATAAGTATAGDDFTMNSGTVTILAGQTTATIVVKVKGDAIDEANETLTVTLSNPSGTTAIATATGTGTIEDDDAPPTISIADASVVEGNDGTTNLVFTITLSAASGQQVTVDYATADGTAVAGTDYVVGSGQVTFAPGETSKTITIQVTPDTTIEQDETLLVNLTNPTNATIADAQATGTIEDDDAPTLSIGDATVVEGDSGTVELIFTVTLSSAQSGSVTVNFATSDGTAVSPADYASQSGTLTFAPGETTKTITILVAADDLDEAVETMTVTLSNPSGGVTLADATGTGSITDNGNDTAPTLSINDQSVTEGNSGTVDMVFTVTLSAASGQTVTVPFSLVGGTATLGSDFQDQTGTLTFAPGETTKTIVVKVIGDTIEEAAETFTVALGAPTNASLVDGVGTGTINDDDPAQQGPTFSIGDVSIVEGNSGTKQLVFTVTLSAASNQQLTVQYATSDGTATAGTDYTTTNGTLTFAAGVTQMTISVPITGDTTVEPHETLNVTLSNPSAGATIADGTAIGTITNDDGTVNISISDVTVTEGNSGTTTATFTVTLSAASDQTVTVNFATAAGTATAGTDFVANNGTLTFAPGETTKTITVTINGDTLDEANETFSVVLSAATNATILDDTGAGVITDDDATPTVSIGDVSIAEGNSGTKTMTFTVTLSAVSGLPVTVNYATSGGTATSGTDFVAANGTVTIAAGQTTATFTVTINGDTTIESNETFTVTLSSPTNATIADGTATGTITDDDSAVTISIGDATVTEGNNGTVNLVFTVTLSGASGGTVTVNFATSNGTATAGSDYTQNSGTITFAPGETSKTITVVVTGDSIDEANETLTVTLSNPSGATIADATATGTITDDDTAGTIQFGNAVFTANENGGTITITVTRTGGTAANATVNYATSNGTATAGSDYTSASGTITFLAGETSKTITISILNDSARESAESFTVTLSSPGGGATLGAQSTTTVTINDDDGATGTPGTNDRFINNLYRDLLGREGEAAGVAFYNAVLQQGKTRGDVAFMFQHSPEYQNKLVNDLYQDLLGRAADAAGLDVHTRLLARGKTIDDVRASILASDEFFTRAGGTNAGFLNALYQEVLNRSIDATGNSIYTGVLSGGGSRSFVASEVLKSIEADRRLSALSYTKYLGRAADTAGNEFQANALQRTYEPRVMAGILASDEYFSKL